jgi:RNA polymerase sigma factor (sigma-70 family)
MEPAPTPTIDREIWKAFCLDPCEGTFAPVFEATHRLVFAICFRVLREPEEASDAFQSTYAHLLAAAAREDGEAIGERDVKREICRCAFREADRLRKRRVRRARREIDVSQLHFLTDATELPDRAAARAETRGRIQEMIDSLPDRYRLPIALHFLDGLKQREIAEALDRPARTISNQIAMGLKRLEPLMRRAGLDGKPSTLAALFTGGVGLTLPGRAAAAEVFAHAKAAAPAVQLTSAAGPTALAGLLSAKTLSVGAVLLGVAVALAGVTLLRPSGPRLDVYSVALTGHDSGVNFARFNPDGAWIFSGGDDARAMIWDATVGGPTVEFTGHAGPVVDGDVSADGARVATASADGTARIWEAATGRELSVLRGHGDRVNTIRFSPDGRNVVTASEDASARIWDAATGGGLAALVGHGRPLWGAEFSPDGARVVTASMDRTARLWDAGTGAFIAVLSGHAGEVNSAEFSPDGRLIVTSSWDGTARLWSGVTGAPIVALRGHAGGVRSARVSPDGSRVVTAAEDNLAIIFDAATGAALVELRDHEDRLWRAEFSGDGSRVLTASHEGIARVWEAATGRPLAVLDGHDNWVTSATFSPDGERVATSSRDGLLRLWTLNRAAAAHNR